MHSVWKIRFEQNRIECWMFDRLFFLIFFCFLFKTKPLFNKWIRAYLLFELEHNYLGVWQLLVVADPMRLDQCQKHKHDNNEIYFVVHGTVKRKTTTTITKNVGVFNVCRTSIFYWNWCATVGVALHFNRMYLNVLVHAVLLAAAITYCTVTNGCCRVIDAQYETNWPLCQLHTRLIWLVYTCHILLSFLPTHHCCQIHAHAHTHIQKL